MHTKGQIIRIKCENVLTYKSMEIFPCEKLNLILGANGSGKSTMIVAIILGLGGNPAVVGRATELSSYVKSGQRSAKIEIELYNDKPEGNDVITRHFNVKNESQFLFNGKRIGPEKLERIAGKYHITLNNLCQILPQEKLEQFARMNDHERLQDTLRTVGNAQLPAWLDELKNYKAREEVARKKLDHLKRSLVEVTRERDKLEIDARSVAEKSVLWDITKLLRNRKTWQTFYHLRETVNRMDALMSGKQEICENMVGLLKKCLINVQNQQRAESHAPCGKEVLRLFQMVKAKQNGISSMTDGISEIKDLFKRKVQKFKSQEDDMKQLNEKISKLQLEVGNTEEINSEIAFTAQELKREESELGELNEQKDGKNYAMERINGELQNINNQLSRMNSVYDQKLRLLQYYSPDAAKGVEWLTRNQECFRGEVYGPMFLYLNVNETQNARYVEMCAANRDLVAFICEYREDSDKLLAELQERQRLKINVVSAVNLRREQLRSRYPIEELRQFGFHSYVIDFIEGPDIIVTYLSKTYNLHNVPVGTADTRTVTHLIPSDIQVYFTDTLRFSVKVADFSKQRIESTTEVAEPKFLKLSVNTADSSEMEARKDNLNQKMAALRRAYEALHGQAKKKEDLLGELRNQLRKLKNRCFNQTRIRDDLKSKERELNSLKHSVIDVNLEKHKTNLTIKLELNKIANALKELSDMQIDLVSASVKYRQMHMKNNQMENADQTVLKITRDFVVSMKEEAHSLRHLNSKKRKVTKYMKSMEQRALKYTHGVDPRSAQYSKRVIFNKLAPSIPVLDRLERKYAAKMNCLGEQGRNVYENYRKATKQVVMLRHKVQKKEELFVEYSNRRDKLKEEFITNVRSLIETINVNFSRHFSKMNCAGEIEFYHGEQGEVEDFNKYGVHIKVKFRETGELQLLNAQTQSGGERAVSVAVYLLSLQELIKVPFRCIDEINQGTFLRWKRREKPKFRRLFTLFFFFFTRRYGCG